VPAPWRLNPGGAQPARIGNRRPRALRMGVLGRHGQPTWRGGSACRAGEFTDLPERTPLTCGCRMRWGSYGELPCEAGFGRHGGNRPRSGPRAAGTLSRERNHI